MIVRAPPHPPAEPALDFCLWPYERPQPPASDALASASLLELAFAVAGAGPRMRAIAAALRDAVGPHATVFGVKWAGGRIGFEFYFYDYARWERRVGMQRVFEALRGLVPVALPVALPAIDDRPYFMFSVEFDDEHARGAKALDTADVYVGVPDTGVSAGLCFGVTAAGAELKNLYYFYDAAHAADARGKAVATARFDGRRLDPAALFWPDVMPAQTLVVANKRHCDGLYFSRIGIDGLIAFLRRLAFPDALVEEVVASRRRLAHHLFDVGYDYEVSDGAVVCLKGSFYGLL